MKREPVAGSSPAAIMRLLLVAVLPADLVPAVQVGAGDGFADVEPRRELLADVRDRVEVLAHVGDVLGRVLVVARDASATRRRRARRARRRRTRRPRAARRGAGASARCSSDSASGSTWCSEVIATAASKARRRFEVEQRDGSTPSLALGVDRGHVVAGAAQHRGQRAVAGADLEHAGGRGRQCGADVGDGVRSGHGGAR